MIIVVRCVVTAVVAVCPAVARAMEAAHAELRKRCPKSEVARMDFSFDDDD